MKNFRVYLRALEPDDYKTTHNWRSDPAYQNGVGSTKRIISLDTEKRWVEQAIRDHEAMKALRFAVVTKDNDQFVGMVYLTNIDFINKNAIMGSLIGLNENRGKGYITEARYLIFYYAFNELGLERISATILEDNTASRNSAEKFGYVNEGLLRNAVYKDGKFKNLVAYSMLKSEFLEKQLKR